MRRATAAAARRLHSTASRKFALRKNASNFYATHKEKTKKCTREEAKQEKKNLRGKSEKREERSSLFWGFLCNSVCVVCVQIHMQLELVPDSSQALLSLSRGNRDTGKERKEREIQRQPKEAAKKKKKKRKVKAVAVNASATHTKRKKKKWKIEKQMRNIKINMCICTSERDSTRQTSLWKAMHATNKSFPPLPPQAPESPACCTTYNGCNCVHTPSPANTESVFF